ncbi:hypothetical protein [Actinokineospora inagensis]|uniref:hypothetical protein n=1 Tax=Actinokineospora inagensis TaxID=103730 RepID=UPI000404D85A|nr:hypothetical protein [Actinokineospora inagensis]
MTADPERLLADALRAQAARTPVPDRVVEPDLAEETVYLGERPTRVEQDLPPRAWWVLGLALLLGLAAGALVGFLTLIH